MYLKEISDSCRFLLNNFPEAYECCDYLNNRLFSKESQNLFQFGYFPSIKDISVLISLIGEKILCDNKFLYTKEINDALGPRTIQFSFFENYPLIIPFRNLQGEIIALVGRTLLSDYERKKINISKYKNTIFKKSNHLFGLFENKQCILDRESVFVVEGQFDVIKAMQIGITNIVALGCSNMSSYQLSILTRYTNNIDLLLDNDEGGEKGRKVIINKFGKFANINNLYISNNYKDIDEYISKENICRYEDISFI